LDFVTHVKLQIIRSNESRPKIIQIILILFFYKYFFQYSILQSLIVPLQKYLSVRNSILTTSILVCHALFLPFACFIHRYTFLRSFFEWLFSSVFDSRLARLFAICHSLSVREDQSKHANLGMPEGNENVVKRSDKSRDNDGDSRDFSYFL